jgi:hypothetical protein
MTALSKYVKQPVNGDLTRYTDAELRKIESVFSTLSQRIEALETLTEQITGTFDPEIAGTAAAGVATYTVRDGFYMKQGRLVVCLGRAEWNAHTGTGNVTLKGLPFIPANNVDGDQNYHVGFMHSGAGISTVKYGLVRPNIAEVFLFNISAANVAIAATGSLIFSFVYYTA